MFFTRVIESCKLASERVVRRKPRVGHGLEEFAPHQRNGEEKRGRGDCGVGAEARGSHSGGMQIMEWRARDEAARPLIGGE